MTKVCIRTVGVDIIHIAADAICDRRKSGHLMCTTGIPGQGSQPTAAAETPDTKKVIGLNAHKLEIVEQIPIKQIPTAHNQKYLETKREKFGHDL